MEFGLGVPHTGKIASAEYVRDFCQAADELGYEGLWTVDHPAIPPHSDSEYTLGWKPKKMPDNSVSDLLAPNYEMTSTMLFVAAGCRPGAKKSCSLSFMVLSSSSLSPRSCSKVDKSSARCLPRDFSNWAKRSNGTKA